MYGIALMPSVQCRFAMQRLSLLWCKQQICHHPCRVYCVFLFVCVEAAPLGEDATPPQPVAAAAAASITAAGAVATAATAVGTMTAKGAAEQSVFDHDPDAGTDSHASRGPAPTAAAAAHVGACQVLVADAFPCEQQQQCGYCAISSPVRLGGKSLAADAGPHIESPAAATAAAGADRVRSLPGQHVMNFSASPPAAAAAAIQSAFSVTRQSSPPAAADSMKGKRVLRSHSSGSSMGRGSRSSSTTPAPMEVAAAAAEGHDDQPPAAAGTDLADGSGNSEQATKQPNQQEHGKGRNCKSRFSRVSTSPPADSQTVAAAAAKPAKRKASRSPSPATAAAGVNDTAAGAGSSSTGTASISKQQGPGSVSHAQNPTGAFGVRNRKTRYEAFLATPPFRYVTSVLHDYCKLLHDVAS